ncbi:ATP-binding protein [Mesorhizobium sp. M1182]|uniref:ATP-binding protein n=1 Tax=Mesorhizobium sp. M1182 TaxID=2957067 RepID=UPI00333BD02A
MQETEQDVELIVDLTGLISIFGDALYTDFGSVVRELVQNAHDGIVEKIASSSTDGLPVAPQFRHRIDVNFSDAEKILVVADNGIGMTADQLSDKLNNFAHSEKRELQQALHGEGRETPDQLIGEYGVGFLSAMAVSDRVEVFSHTEGTLEAAVWSFDKGSRIANVKQIAASEAGKARGVHRVATASGGTMIVCSLSQSIVNLYTIDSLSVSGSLENFTKILPFDLYFNGDLLNPQPSAWIDPAHATENDWREAIVKMTDDEPLYIIPVYSSPKELDLQGVLWFPRRRRIQDEGRLDIFIKRMFVMADDSIVLPSWARFLRGMINSNKLRRIVSGNTVKSDSNASDVRKFLTQCIHDAFRTLRTLTEDEYWRIIGPHDDVIKECAVDNPELLEIVWDKMRLRARTRKMTIPAYLEELRRFHKLDRTLYCFESHAQEFAANLVSDATHIPIFALYSRADSLFADAVCAKEEIEKVNFRALADKLFAPLNADDATQYRTLLSACAENNIAADLRRFEPLHIPAILIEDKTMHERREELLHNLRDASGDRQRQFVEDLEALFKRDRAANKGVAFYLNVGNELIRELREVPYDAQVAVCRALYNMSYMSAVPELRSNEVQAVYGSICTVLMDLLREIKQSLAVSLPEPGSSKGVGGGRVRSSDEPTRMMLFMPFENRYNNLEAAVRDVFEDKPYFFEVVLARDFMREGRIIESVRAHIAESDAFIADISDANPSVMMEVGAALIAEAGPLFLLRSANAGAEMPADLRAELSITYERLDDDPAEIAAAIKASLERKGTPSHRDIQVLMDKRLSRAISHTLLARLRYYRLTEDEMTRLTTHFKNLDGLLRAEASEITDVANLKPADAESFRRALIAHIE